MVDYVSIFTSSLLVIVTAVLAYFTYVLGKHTKTLSKVSIKPHFVEEAKPTIKSGMIVVEYKNEGKGVATHVNAEKRDKNGQRFSAEQSVLPRDSIPVGSTVMFGINESF